MSASVNVWRRYNQGEKKPPPKKPPCPYNDQCEDCGELHRWIRENDRCPDCGGNVRPGEWLEMRVKANLPKAPWPPKHNKARVGDNSELGWQPLTHWGFIVPWSPYTAPPEPRLSQWANMRAIKSDISGVGRLGFLEA